MSGGFEDLGLLPELVRATQDQGWLLPSAVQDEAIPLILGGGDVMVAAETGSGKTGAFALPAIQLVHEARRTAMLGARGGGASGGGAARSATGESAAKRARVDEAVKLNASDRSSMLAVNADGLVCQSRQEREWAGVRANTGVVSGRYYYEATVRDGMARVGWSSMAGALDLGTDRGGYGFGATGKKSTGGKFEPFGEPFGAGDVIGCSVEVTADGGAVAFSKNGAALGTAFPLPRRAGPLYPALCMRNGEVAVNFGAAPFAHAPPAGWGSLEEPLSAHDTVRAAAGAAASAAAVGAAGGGWAGPACLVLEPARDLAEQTHRALAALARHVSGPAVTAALLIGGVDAKETARQLRAAPDIVTATPAKLLDLVEGGRLALGGVRLLVLDEADRFCEEESARTLDKIFTRLRAAVDAAAAAAAAAGGDGASSGGGRRLQVAFFSATLHSPEVARLSGAMCVHPTWVDLKGRDSVPDTVHHLVVRVDADADRSWAVPAGGGGPSLAFRTDGVHAAEAAAAVRSAAAGGAAPLSAEALSEGAKRLKQRMLLSLIDSLRMEQCLVFCRTNVDCDNLEAFLTAAGGGARFRGPTEKGKENRYSCVVLAGGRAMEERRRNLEAFRAGDVRFLVCTDVAARGLDVRELPYVVNMCLPDETENYIHRIGRVGRADRMGLAVSLVAAAPEKVWFHANCANRGAGCANTKLVPAGGCCVWYDEPALLRAVQRRLGVDPSQGGAGIPVMPVVPAAAAAARAAPATGAGGASAPAPALPYTFSLPAEYAHVAYGEERDEGGAASSAHVEQIRGQVAVLAGLEVRSQGIFLRLRARFAQAAAAPATVT